MKTLILFGHGARDIRWREPFDRMAQLWKAQHPETMISVAFLELMKPSLEDAITLLIQEGATAIYVIPVFFGQGSHLRNDFPLLMSAHQEKYSNVKIIATPAVGEDLTVLQAILDFGARELL